MNDLPTIRWGCLAANCVGDDGTAVWHETRCWPTETPGLVVVDDTTTHGANETPWQITHAVSGLAVPGWYGSPEAAMAGAAALKDLEWDWTQCEMPPLDVQYAALTILNRFGRERAGSVVVAPEVANREFSP